MNSNRTNFWGTIISRSVEPSGTPPSVDPAACAYTFMLDEPADAGVAQVVGSVSNHLPTRRISVGARIIPAEPGDPCIVSVRGSLVVLWAFTEGLPFEEAC